MKKILLSIVLLVLFLFNISLIGRQRIVLPDILPPQTFEIGKDNIYLATDTTISVMSLSDFKIKRNLGRKGEGPGEFISIDNDMGLSLYIHKNSIFVNSNGKVSYFTKNGKFVKELRTKDGYFHKPFGNKFVGLNYKIENQIMYNVVTLYDKNFKIIKELYKKKHWFQRGKKLDPVDVSPPAFRIYKDLIFTEDGNGNIIVFDKTGENINSTKIKFDNKIITEKDKKNYHNYYKSHPVYKNQYSNLKHLIKFPESFPLIKFFDVSDSKLYVFTNRTKVNKSELYIFDLKGKLIKKKYIEISEINKQEVYPLIRVKMERYIK